MGKASGTINVEELSSMSIDLASLLGNTTDLCASDFENLIRNYDAIRLAGDSLCHNAQLELQDCERRIHECTRETEKINAQVVDDSELDESHKELQSLSREEVLLREELSAVIAEIADLERKRILVETQEQDVKKINQEELKSLKTLSMYASVTNIIPCLDDDMHTCGQVLRRERKMLEKFKFDNTEFTPSEIREAIWKMIDS